MELSVYTSMLSTILIPFKKLGSEGIYIHYNEFLSHIELRFSSLYLNESHIYADSIGLLS